MFKQIVLRRFAILFLILGIKNLNAQDYIIYSITQDFPMGIKDEKLRKNYYLNLGENQGISVGTTLNVYRTISQLNPLDSNKRYNYKVKIGELEVIHSEKEIAIGQLLSLRNDEKTPQFELKDFMIGDKIEASTN